MNPIRSYLEQQGFLVLDGGLATELERRGADLNDPLWSARCLLESPELISQVHADYLRAGADIITSATYQASVQGFMVRGLSEREAAALIRSGVDLARRARDEFWSVSSNRRQRLKPLVAASVGPFGACLHDGSEYHGNYGAVWEEVASFHSARLDVLTDCGADLLAVETIPSIHEAELLLELLTACPGQAAWMSFSCRDDLHVSHGESFREAAVMASRHPQIVAVGINCTAPRHITALLNSVRSLDCPLVVYPNSGESWVAEDNSWQGQGTGGLDPLAWFNAGARLIGGCCRTGPADVVFIRSALKSAAAMP